MIKVVSDGIGKNDRVGGDFVGSGHGLRGKKHADVGELLPNRCGVILLGGREKRIDRLGLCARLVDSAGTFCLSSGEEEEEEGKKNGEKT